MRLHSVGALFLLQTRGLVRTRTFAALFGTVVLSSLLLPQYVRGDGTMEGRIHILLQYSLGMTAVVLGLSALWTACAALPSEIQSRRIHLIATKPATRFELCLGFWLSITCVHLLLMATAGLFVGVQAAILLRTPTPETEMMSYAHHVLTPDLGITSEEVAERVDVFRAAGGIPEDVPEAVVRSKVRRQIKRERMTVQEDQTVTWSFTSQTDPNSAAHLYVRFRLAASLPGDIAELGRWEMRDAAGQWRQLDQFVPTYAGGLIRVPDALTWHKEIQLRHTNLAKGEQMGSIMLNTEDGLQVLVAGTRLGQNIVRFVVVYCCQLAFLAALGMMMGAVLSQSVAAFVSGMLWVMTWLARYIRLNVDPEDQRVLYEEDLSLSWLREVIEVTFRAVDTFTAPLFRFDVLPQLARGESIAASLMIQAFAFLVCAYALVCLLTGVGLLRRRELGNP